MVSASATLAGWNSSRMFERPPAQRWQYDMIVPLSVSREKSIFAVDAALAEQRVLLLVAQRDSSVEEPKPEDLYTIGTAAAVMRMLKLPDGRIRLLVQGLARGLEQVAFATACQTPEIRGHRRAEGDMVVGLRADPQLHVAQGRFVGSGTKIGHRGASCQTNVQRNLFHELAISPGTGDLRGSPI